MSCSLWFNARGMPWRSLRHGQHNKTPQQPEEYQYEDQDQIAWGTRTEASGSRIRFPGPPAHFWHFIILLSIQKSEQKQRQWQWQASRHKHSRDTEAGKATRTGTCLSLGVLAPWSCCVTPAYHLCQTRSFWLLVAIHPATHSTSHKLCHLFCLPVMPCGIAFVSLPFMTLYWNPAGMPVCVCLYGLV